MSGPPIVEFHTGVAQPVAHLCQTLRRLQPSLHAPVLVTAPAPLLADIDRALWTVLEREFLAHGVVGTGDADRPAMAAAMAARTPVWLAASVDGVPPRSHAWWLNLGAAAPVGPWPAPRAVEVVADDADAAAAARERWRSYRQRGCATEHRPAGSASS